MARPPARTRAQRAPRPAGARATPRIQVVGGSRARAAPGGIGFGQIPRNLAGAENAYPATPKASPRRSWRRTIGIVVAHPTRACARRTDEPFAPRGGPRHRGDEALEEEVAGLGGEGLRGCARLVLSITSSAWSQTPLAVFTAKKSSAHSASCVAARTRSKSRIFIGFGEKPFSRRMRWIVGWLTRMPIRRNSSLMRRCPQAGFSRLSVMMWSAIASSVIGRPPTCGWRRSHLNRVAQRRIVVSGADRK